MRDDTMLLQLVRLRSGVWIGVAAAVVGWSVLAVTAFGTSTRRLTIGRKAVPVRLTARGFKQLESARRLSTG
jgi:hypothetical protein